MLATTQEQKQRNNKHLTGLIDARYLVRTIGEANTFISDRSAYAGKSIEWIPWIFLSSSNRNKVRDLDEVRIARWEFLSEQHRKDTPGECELSVVA